MSNEVQRYITGIMTPVEMANPGPASISARQTVVVTYDDYAALMLQAQGLEAERERLKRENADIRVKWTEYGRELEAERDALSAQLEAIRAAGGEQVEVVAYQCGESGRLFSANFSLSKPEPLMRISQHGRIVAAMAAELEQVREERDAIAGRLASTVHYIRRIDRRNDHPGRFDAEMNLLIREAIRQAEPVPPLAGQVSGQEWVPVSERLPELDVPVWLFIPETGEVLVGERCSSTDGWLWSNCSRYFMRQDGSWVCEDGNFDDFEPSLWMPLPIRPTLLATPSMEVKS